MESLGVPLLGIGDEMPNYAAEATTGEVSIHDWINAGQTYKEGEAIFSLILTFGALQNPVVVSELAWLGSAETQKLLSTRRVRVLCVALATMFSLRSFLGEVETLVDADGWSVASMPIIADEVGDFHRIIGGVRPGAADAVRGRVPSNTTLIVSPTRNVMLRTEYPITTGRNFPVRTFLRGRHLDHETRGVLLPSCMSLAVLTLGFARHTGAAPHHRLDARYLHLPPPRHLGKLGARRPGGVLDHAEPGGRVYHA